MLYNNEPMEDVANILTYINKFTKDLGIQKVQVSSLDVLRVCISMRQQFPHCDGIGSASAFKKVANFVAWFCSWAPIKSTFPVGCIRGLDSDSCNPNAIIAFDIAIACLQGSKIQSKKGEKTVSNPLYVSDHSYGDIIFALSQEKIEAKTHYHLLSVFFEQLTYKSNKHCEYGHETGGISKENNFYPVNGIDYDTMAGI
jgi:hypothetical protein